MAVAWVVLIPLALCGGILLVTLLGKMFFQVLGGGTANQQAVTPVAQTGPGVNSLLGLLVGMAILLAVFVMPVLFWAGVSRKVTYPSQQSSAFDAPQQMVFGNNRAVFNSSHTFESSNGNEQAELINSLENAITKLEKTDIPSPTLQTLRGLKQTLPTLYKSQGEATASDEEGTVQLAEAPLTVPGWARQPATGGLQVIESDPCISEEEAVKDAWGKAAKLLASTYEEANGPMDWRVDLRELGAVRKEYTEQFPWDFKAESGFDSATEGKDYAYKTYLQVDTSPEVLSSMYGQWRRVTSKNRVEVVTVAAGLLIGAVTLLAVFFRIEKRGFIRRSARFASLLGAAGLVVGSCGVAAEGLNNVRPPRAPAGVDEAVGEEHYVIQRPAVGGSSEFSGIPIDSRRLGFIVVGDGSLGNEANSKLIASEIAKCVNSFKEIDYKIFCESSRQRIQFGGTASSNTPTNESAIKRIIQVAFPRKSESVFPDKTINNVLMNYGPDRVVIICNSADKHCNEAQQLMKAFGRDVPADIFQFSDDELALWSVPSAGSHCD